MQAGSVTKPFGILKVSKIEGIPRHKLTLKEVLYWTMPHAGLSKEVLKWRVGNCRRMLDQLWRLQLMKKASAISKHTFMYGTLWVRTFDGKSGKDTLYGIASFNVVTNAGRDELVDEFDAATAAGFDLTTFNYHAIGTGSTAEAATQTALTTELTTEYNPNSTRATGTQSQPTSDVYSTVATNTLDSGTPTINEHGLLSQAATGGGTLWDRSLTGALPLVGTNGDGLQTTYNLTVASGG